MIPRVTLTGNHQEDFTSLLVLWSRHAHQREYIQRVGPTVLMQEVLDSAPKHGVYGKHAQWLRENRAECERIIEGMFGLTKENRMPASEINFVPLYDFVLLDPIKRDEKTKGGVVIPETSKGLEDIQRSVCVKAGPGIHKDNGTFVPNPIQVGDTVFNMARGAAFKVVLDGHFYICCSGRDCIAIENRKGDA